MFPVPPSLFVPLECVRYDATAECSNCFHGLLFEGLSFLVTTKYLLQNSLATVAEWLCTLQSETGFFFSCANCVFSSNVDAVETEHPGAVRELGTADELDLPELLSILLAFCWLLSWHFSDHSGSLVLQQGD